MFLSSNGQFLSLQACAAVASLCLAGCWALSGPAEAQVANMANGPASIPLAVTAKSELRPLWKELTPAQQEALKPLALHWNDISEPQKRKWLALSANYGKMNDTERANLHERMLDWGSLSVAERSRARLNFAEAKRLTPSEKKAKWEAYQTLSTEEKNQLAKQAPAKLPGAATAVRPVSPQKLVVVPPARKDVVKNQSIATEAHQIDPKTLLPLALQRVELNNPAGSPPAKTTAQ
ncbi:MAG: DUF3106 domain-containing protein [Burkholderiales bacterium]|nr:DUF3106 domain-containing protein [Burkholderiales bacterium]